MILCIICYVALPFNHTLKIDGHCSIVQLQYRNHRQKRSMQEVELFYLDYFTYFIPSLLILAKSLLFETWWSFYHVFFLFLTFLTFLEFSSNVFTSMIQTEFYVNRIYALQQIDNMEYLKYSKFKQQAARPHNCLMTLYQLVPTTCSYELDWTYSCIFNDFSQLLTTVLLHHKMH